MPIASNYLFLRPFFVLLGAIFFLPDWGIARESKAARRELTRSLRQTYIYMEKSDACGRNNKDLWDLAQKSFTQYEQYRAQIVHKLAKKPQLELADLEKKARLLLAEKKDANAFCRKVSEIKSLLVKGLSVAVSPTQIPNLKTGKDVYQQKCAACHGNTGRGDGPLARGGKAPMNPPPTDFTDPMYVAGASPFRAYNALLVGMPDSAMGGFDDILDDHELWSVAFFLNALTLEAGGAKPPEGLFSLKDLASLSDRELKGRLQDAGIKEWGEVLRYLRTKEVENGAIPREASPRK